MENCLFTKVKDIVNNDAMSKIGELIIPIKYVEDAPTGLISLTETEGFHVEALDGGYFSLSDDFSIENRKTSHDFQHFTGLIHKMYIPNINFRISISSKYVIKSISLSSSSSENLGSKRMVLDLEKLYGCSLLESLTTSRFDVIGRLSDIADIPLKSITSYYGESLKGNLSDLSKHDALTVVNIQSGLKLDGELADLGENTSLTTINLLNAVNVYGSVEDFVVAQRNASTPRVTSSGITVNLGGTNITYQGEPVPTGSRTLSWTESSISLV